MTRHKRLFAAWTAVIIVPLMCLLTIGAEAGAESDPLNDFHSEERYEPPPGEGVICMMAIYNAAAEVGRRCFPGQNPELQETLEQAVTRIDTYVLENSEASPALLETFKREQAHVGAPEEMLCQGNLLELYKSAASTGVEVIRSHLDELLAVPGEPTWGDCL